MNIRTAIIGGGLSGLTVASELCRRGDESVAIFESSDHLGGTIATSSQDGFLIDHGADMFATQPGAAVQLCRDLGIDSELIQPSLQRRGAMVWSKGKMHPIPQGFVLMRATELGPLMRSGLLSIPAKFRFAMERFISKSPPEKEESVGQFVRRRMGHGVLDHLVAPLVAGIYTADIDRLSMSAAMGPIAAMEQQYGSLFAASRHRRAEGLDGVEQQSAGARYGNFRSFADGMGGLIRRIENSLPTPMIHRESPVQSIVREADDRWRITFGDLRGDVHAERLVLATPPAPTSRIVGSIDRQLADAFAKIESASAAIICLGLDKAQIARPIDAFGFVVPPRERSPLIAGSFASHKFEGRAPQEHVLLRCFVGGVLNPELVENDDQTLVKIVLKELKTMIGLTGTPVLRKVIRWRSAMPQYNVGHQNRIDQIRDQLQRHQNLFWTNNADGGVGIAPTIASAKKLAIQLTQPSAPPS